MRRPCCARKPPCSRHSHTAGALAQTWPYLATARKLATGIYRALRWGQPYVDKGAEPHEQRYRETRLTSLKDRAADLGYKLAWKPVTP